jgi:hypothetical protein
MRLVKITEDLYVNPERVVSVERRTTTRSSGEEYTYVELALETMIRWTLDIPLSDVVLALDPHRGELR